MFTDVYFVFFLNYYCLIITKDQNDFEFLFTQTILVTLYLTTIDFIIYLPKFFIDDGNILFYIQFVAAGILDAICLLILLRSIIMSILSCCKGCEYSEGICTCQLCCCNKHSSCYSDCCNLKCSKCNCSYICLQPCCSVLYDCLVG